MKKIIEYIGILFLGLVAVPQSLDAQLVTPSNFQVLLEVVENTIEDTLEMETDDTLLELLLGEDGSIDILLDAEEETETAEVSPEGIVEAETEDNLLDLFLEGGDSTDILAEIEVEMVALITLSNIEEMASLHIRVGTTEGADDILNQVVVYDDPTPLPSGYSYLRNGNEIRLGLGKYMNMGDYHAEITATDMDGATSPALLFSSTGIDD